jgi:hypothetical protein
MCTASWLIAPDGYEVFFNRDESRRRGTALAPEELDLGGVRALLPVDSDAGGTWLGVNEFGLALGLLNGTDARGPEREPPHPETRSRGLLVRDLLRAREADEVLEALEKEALDRYRGFTLALFEPGREPRIRTWDGERLVATPARVPLASSSLDGGRARAERERVFAELHAGRQPTRESLERFQASHAPARGPWSPCMHRAEAATVSASRVRVDARAVALRYAPGPPCTTAFGDWLELERRPRERG